MAALSLSEMRTALAALDQDVDDAERVARIRLLEEIKSVAAAAQARETTAFATSQQAQQRAVGVPVERSRRGIAAQVGLARRCSPWSAARYLGWSAILTSELPHTYAALTAGVITEWRAIIVARETAWLTREQRAVIDAELADRLEHWGDGRVEREVKKAAYRLDPRSAVQRANRAAKDRRVTVRPAPETMAVLSILAPVAQSVAAYAALRRQADTLTGTGDPRGRGQIMADTAIERLTGQAEAGAVPVEINLIMTDQTFFGRGGACTDHADDGVPGEAPTAAATSPADEPAHLLGYGPIPAPLARELVLGPDPSVPRWIRRLYTHPGTGDLLTMDSHRRQFTPGMRHFLQVRDHTCRTPFCDAPIRHGDHIERHTDGGPTVIGNGQGLCEACNYATEAPGWAKTVDDDTITLHTPTGASYQSRPPDPPGKTSTPHRAGPAIPIILVDYRHIPHAA